MIVKKYLSFFLLGISYVGGRAQDADKGVFLLHKFQQQLGKESYSVNRRDSVLHYSIDFRFVDRGTAVPLKASIDMTMAGEPRGLYTKGNTSRMSTINDSVTMRGSMADIRVDDSVYRVSFDANSFPIAGYSPTTVQMLLIRFWEQHGRPAVVHTLPGGDIHIAEGGVDKFTYNHRELSLKRFIVSGLIWGNEMLWTDEKGQLYCLLTNDAEGDKLEAMLEPYEELLPAFIDKAADYGMRLFSDLTRTAMKDSRHIVIRNTTVADVETGRNIPGMTILIEDGKIRSIAAEGVDIPADSYEIDGRGKTVLPGLWDMHAHFEQVEWGPAYLAAGVTTVRDCGNEIGFINSIQRAIDEGRGVGPHILKAGIIDGKGSMALGIIQASTPEEAVKEVRTYKDSGFVQIKIYSSVRSEVVKAICEEAHKLGLTVTGHIPNGMNLMQGVEAGMDMVNHEQYVNAVLKKSKDRTIDFNDPENVKIFDFILTHHVVIDPTLSVFEWVFRSVADPVTDIEPAFNEVPGPLQALFVNTGMPAAQASTYRQLMTNMEQQVAFMFRKGIPIVAGTDMGIPGYSLYREMELYVKAGLKPYEALQTATLIPARVMKRDGFSGTVAVGKDADLIIVDGDPLSRIQDIRKLQTVIRAGRIYDPRVLHQMVGFR